MNNKEHGKVKYLSLNDINQKNNLTIDFLKQNAPHIFDDNKINIEKLKQHLGLENNLEQNEKYGLNWIGKSKAFFETTKTSTMTLVPQRDKSLNFDESNNIIIQGDNLEILKLLEKSYFNKIDIIYIDPPYNTGNDFVYNDEFKQSKKEFDVENDLIDEDGNKQQTRNTRSDGKFHTNWLNMMYPRLILARKLLKDDGVIFISIDDNEQARLKMICDEIFGEQNFVSNFVWQKKSGGGQAKYIYEGHEYILLYSKSKKMLIGKLGVLSNRTTREIKIDSIGRKYYLETDYVRKEFGKKSKEINHRNCFYEELYDWKDTSTINDINKKIENKELELVWSEKHKMHFIAKKIYLVNDKYVWTIPYSLIQGIWTSDGNNELEKIFKDNIFNNPKPIQLLKIILNMNKNENSLILDFFAGSGTTGQAVMELNKEDGGNRKYILVQLDEKLDNKNKEFQYISDITRERIKRSIEINDYKEKGFKYFKLIDSNLKSFDSSTSDSIETIQSKLFDIENKIKDSASIEDLIYEIILRIGKLPLDTKIVSQIIENNNVYYDESKTCLFLLESSINSKHYENIIDVVKKFFSKEQHLIVFLNDRLFKNDQDKINFAEEINNLSKDNIELVVI